MLALYVASDQVSTLYGDPLWLWGMVAVVLLWLARMWRLAMAGLMDDDPVLFATRDAVSWGAHWRPGLRCAGGLASCGDLHRRDNGRCEVTTAAGAGELLVHGARSEKSRCDQCCAPKASIPGRRA